MADLNSFVVIAAAVLALLSLIAAGVAVVGGILYRSTLQKKELATRRVLGARRSHIVRMLISDNVSAIAMGLVLGTLAILSAAELRRPWLVAVLMGSAALILGAGLVGAWLAGRHAAKVPFSASGLFRTSSDTRGQS